MSANGDGWMLNALIFKREKGALDFFLLGDVFFSFYKTNWLLKKMSVFDEKEYIESVQVLKYDM